MVAIQYRQEVVRASVLFCTLVLACGNGSEPLAPDSGAPGDCGNARLERGEECDDGNASDGDGCSSACRFEAACPMPWTEGVGAVEDVPGSSFGSRAVSPLPTHYPERYGGEVPTFPPLEDIRWGQYPFAVTDDVAPTPAELEEFVRLFEDATGKGVAIYNHPADVEVGADVTQIVLNLEYGASLATIALPPGWDPANTMPVLVSGNPGSSSNNKRLFQSGSYGNKYLLMPALAAAADAPLIAVVHNTGGVASHGYHPRVMRDIGCVIDTVSEQFGGDRNSVTFVGKSRGGGSALTWGANPLGLDYTTVGVFAHTPIWGNDYVMERPVSIAPVPAMLAASATYGPESFYESAEPGRDDVVEAFLSWVSPEGTFASTAEHQVAAHVSGLAQVPAVAACVATHDQELLSPDGVRMFEALREAGVEHLSEVVIRGAHVDCPVTSAALDEHLRYILGLQEAPPQLSQRVWSQETTLGEILSPVILGPQEGLPTWGILPVAAEVQTTLEVHLCGAGGNVEVVGTYQPDEGTESELLRASQQVGETCAIVSAEAPEVPGVVRWSISLPEGEASAHAIEPGRALETRIFAEPLAVEEHLWNTSDTRVAGFAVVPSP